MLSAGPVEMTVDEEGRDSVAIHRVVIARVVYCRVVTVARDVHHRDSVAIHRDVIARKLSTVESSL